MNQVRQDDDEGSGRFADAELYINPQLRMHHYINLLGQYTMLGDGLNQNLRLDFEQASCLHKVI
jgi:hypothetical protein